MHGTYTLSRDSCDAEIRAGLPVGHVFQAGADFYAFLYDMMKRRSGDTEGDLLNDGRVNIFYVNITGGRVVPLCVICVTLNPDLCKWVLIMRLREGAQNAGSRVFSATAVA